MENKTLWIFACFVLAVLIAGCISNAVMLKKEYEPNYAFSAGDHLTYEVTSAEEKQDTATKNVLEMDVTRVNEKLTELHITPKNSITGQNVEPHTH